MPLGAGNTASTVLDCPGRDATCATLTAHAESSGRAMQISSLLLPRMLLRVLLHSGAPYCASG